jgi:putative transposase
MKSGNSNDIIYSCRYYIVFCPKYRRKVLTGDVALRLEELIREICEDLQVELMEMEIEPDHVKLLLNIDPQLGVHKVVKQIKRVTSHELRSEFEHLTTKLPTLWTNSYFITTIGSKPRESVMQYIRSQKTSQRK